MIDDDKRARQRMIEAQWRSMWGNLINSTRHGRKARHGSAYIRGTR